MPPPVPLTRTPAPSLDFSQPGTPAAEDFGDIYFSIDGGLAESRAVFLEGCGLPNNWMGREVFTIAELGFGSGLNFLAAWQAWRDSGATGRLHFISVEAFPFERRDLSRALAHFPELAELATPLIESWPGPVRGVHRRHFGSITLTLIHDAVAPALTDQSFQADAWFLDGFSPAKNPDMWSPAIISDVARLSAPGARVATFTVAGAVRRALSDAGFEVEKKEGFGRKRQRLEARLPEQATAPTRPQAPTIIGAGIAGASIAAAFLRRGINPTVLFDPDHIAASENGAALIKPRLDLQDRPESRFFLSSFLYAREIYRGATRYEGLVHCPKTDSEAVRLARIAAQMPLGANHLRWTDETLEMDSSLVIDTEAARTSLLAGADVQARRVDSLDSLKGPIIFAGGYGVRTLLPDVAFRFSRGQLSWGSGGIERPVTYGGYAIPIRGQILLGATHDRIENHDTAFELRAEDDAANLAQAISQGLDLDPDVKSFRASVRVTTADTLPRLVRTQTTKAEQDLWILSGLGSRGFVFAPLLGEALVSAYLGEPSPLADSLSDKLSRRPD